VTRPPDFLINLSSAAAWHSAETAPREGRNVMAKKPKVDFDDFLIAMRESYETGHSDRKLIRKVIEMAKHFGIKLSIMPGKK
jgi:hypothetical protein